MTGALSSCSGRYIIHSSQLQGHHGSTLLTRRPFCIGWCRRGYFQRQEAGISCFELAGDVSRKHEPMGKNLVSVLFFCCWLTATYACTCMMPDRDSYCTKTIVFNGTAVAWNTQDDVHTDVYTFWIDQIFWAEEDFNDTQAINVTAISWEELCGFSFQLDTPYVVAARFVSGSFRSGLCDGNRLWNSLQNTEKRFFSKRIGKYCARKIRENQK